MSLSIIITVLLFSILPLILWMVKYPKDYKIKEGNWLVCGSVLIGVIVCLTSYISIGYEFNVLSLILGASISLIVADSLVFKKIAIKSFLKFVLTILLFFSSSIFQIIPIKLFGITSENITPAISNYLTFFGDLVLFIILGFIYYDELKRDFLKLKSNFNNIFDESLKIWLLGFALMFASNILISNLIPNAVAGNENAVQSMIEVSPFVMLICAGFIAPVTEELTFRQAFRNIFKNKWFFILTSGLVFGFLHVVFAYESLIDFVYVVPYAALGISFAYMVDKTDNIFSSIMMHCLHNSMIIIFSIMVGMIVL